MKSAARRQPPVAKAKRELGSTTMTRTKLMPCELRGAPHAVQMTCSGGMLDATVLYPPNIQSHPGQAMPIVKFTQDNMTMTRSMQEMGSVDGHVREPKAFMPQSALPSSHKRGPVCTRVGFRRNLLRLTGRHRERDSSALRRTLNDPRPRCRHRAPI